jgi:Lon protease-like protein
MTNFIPIFPLSLVVFPGEQLNLHIFEPRYKQLINDCFTNKKLFGIPSVIDQKMEEMGTLVEIQEISKIYDDGKMDIKTKGVSSFKILEIIKEIPEKLYSGAIVSYSSNINDGKPALMKIVLESLKQVHENLGVNKKFSKPEDELLSYDVAHHIGLSIEEEYQLLTYSNELFRQEFLKRHLTKVLSVMREMQHLQKKIQMNGHFKNLEGYNF